jgi:hypothetical protein
MPRHRRCISKDPIDPKFRLRDLVTNIRSAVEDMTSETLMGRFKRSDITSVQKQDIARQASITTFVFYDLFFATQSGLPSEGV